MNVHAESYQRSIVTPFWNSPIKKDKSLNQQNYFPQREWSYSKRCYGRMSIKQSLYKKDLCIFPTFNKQIRDISLENSVPDPRSHTTMGFCSTSKVKHMYLYSKSQNPYAGLKMGTTHPAIYPPTPRSVSRPILLHGKRFTVTPQSSCNSTSVMTLKTDIPTLRSEQRKRFYEAEQHKLCTKMSRETLQKSGPLPSNYYISGQKLNFFGGQHSLQFSRTNTQPDLRNKFIKKSDKTLQTNNAFITLQDNADEDKINTEIYVDPNFNEVTVELSNGTKEKSEISLDHQIYKDLSECIESSLLMLQSTEVEPEILQHELEWLSQFMESFVDEINDVINFSNKKMEDIWTLLLYDKNTKAEVITISKIMDGWIPLQQDEIEVSQIFSNDGDMLQDNEILILQKIFAKLKISNISRGELHKLMECSDLFSNKDTNLMSLVGVYFFIQLYSEIQYLFGVDASNKDSVARYLVYSIVSYNHSLSDVKKLLLTQRICNFVDQIENKDLNLLFCIPFILETHGELFERPISIKEIIYIKAIICLMGTLS